MGRYLFIESRDPFESSDVDYLSQILTGCVDRNHEVILCLVQNGVLQVRKGNHSNERVTRLLKRKVKVLADEFALRERAVREVLEGVESATIGQLIDLGLEKGTKVIWH